ncbi:efflux RND transporter periplasmic adaptor subunit [Azospirillum canadense]|uniref:efflux RND transporter periplasmic adaptor subunit n=1 Tax=Azospirillum canadense TaxID=403962 RepID=UPI0022268EC1|nr:efflux RND transporter periplasmic adaptor subunit [Azospirillum canadense]MCW2241154.1 RND family efflux transporter MFP subunit [Azospirillum canadense]
MILVSLLLLAACGEKNHYVAPPPVKVTVAHPVQQPFTRYLEATGNAAAVNSVDLVARVQGFVQEIHYKDGDVVKQGAPLFTIEPEPYQVRVTQAQATEDGATATLKQADAEYKRQAELALRDNTSKSALDQALATRALDQANLTQAKTNTRLAQINLGYTQVTAPFDGIVTARLVSVGELVGTSPTQLATIVQLDPVYVTFNISEPDLLRVRALMKRRGLTPGDLKKVPVEVGLQSETGYPHKGLFDYAAPIVNAATGTLPVRAVFQNADRALLPGLFLRVRVPIGEDETALMVPDAALGSDQGSRYVLVVNQDNVVEQRKVEVGPSDGGLRVIDSGLKPDDRVIVAGAVRAIPGQKVDPQVQTAAAAIPVK